MLGKRTLSADLRTSAPSPVRKVASLSWQDFTARLSTAKVHNSWDLARHLLQLLQQQCQYAGSGAPSPAAASASIACVYPAPEGTKLAPCVLAHHPDWYAKKHIQGTPRLNAHGFWQEPKKEHALMQAVKKPGSQHEGDVALSEMRQYGNKKMVLVMNPQPSSSSASESDTEAALSSVDIDYEPPRDLGRQKSWHHRCSHTTSAGNAMLAATPHNRDSGCKPCSLEGRHFCTCRDQDAEANNLHALQLSIVL